MGNRAVAVIISASEMLANGEINPNQIGVYLHWNGGRDSVEAFLEYCRLRGFRPPNEDSYGWARFCQVVGNFFGGDGLSLGVGRAYELDCRGDNGVYVQFDWKIVGRLNFKGEEQNAYELQDMLLSIDEAQPYEQQIREYLLAEEVDVSDVRIGDQIIMFGLNGELEEHTVVGIGQDGVVNGHDIKGVPFVDRYDHDGDYNWNINNYLLYRWRRVCK